MSVNSPGKTVAPKRDELDYIPYQTLMDNLNPENFLEIIDGMARTDVLQVRKEAQIRIRDSADVTATLEDLAQMQYLTNDSSYFESKSFKDEQDELRRDRDHNLVNLLKDIDMYLSDDEYRNVLSGLQLHLANARTVPGDLNGEETSRAEDNLNDADDSKAESSRESAAEQYDTLQDVISNSLHPTALEGLLWGDDNGPPPWKSRVNRRTLEKHRDAREMEMWLRLQLATSRADGYAAAVKYCLARLNSQTGTQITEAYSP